MQDKLLLLADAITLAFTSHSIHAADKKLQLNPVGPQFCGKDMGLTLGVLGLFWAEEVGRKGNPEDLPQA